jgi:hypothetical protein
MTRRSSQLPKSWSKLIGVVDVCRHQLLGRVTSRVKQFSGHFRTSRGRISPDLGVFSQLNLDGPGHGENTVPHTLRSRRFPLLSVPIKVRVKLAVVLLLLLRRSDQSSGLEMPFALFYVMESAMFEPISRRLEASLRLGTTLPDKST